MAYFLGCDVSKRKLDLCLVEGFGAEVWAGQVANEEMAIAELLLTLTGSYSDVTCVVEATSSYHIAFAETAHAVGLPCLVFNPILTRQQIKATVRGKKTDKTDALMIARLGLRGEGRQYVPETYRTTKYLARGRWRIGELAGALKRYESHLDSLLGGEPNEGIMDTLKEMHKAFKIAERRFEKEMTAATPNDLSERLQTIPGVGPFIAASVIGEIQDMHRFRSSKELIAFAGLDPRVKQNGHTLNVTGRLTKRGSHYLRHSLFLAASVARQHDPNFKALYDKKRAEGKSYTVAVCVVARKLLAVMRAMWLSEERYDLCRATVNHETLNNRCSTMS
jgi:transposase